MQPRVCSAAALLLVATAMLVGAPGPVAEARREKGGPAAAARSVECAVCHAVAVELQLELEKTANSTEVIELSRRPASDLGKSQHRDGGRAIKYVDSEMRITDALQAACQALKRSYRVQTVGGRRRLAQVRRVGDRPAATDLEGVDWNAAGDKIHSVCEELAEERERDIIAAVRASADLAAAVCYKARGPCGSTRAPNCSPGEISFAADGSGGEPCWTCERGKYQPLSGSSACVACAVNSSTSERGSTSPSDCRSVCPAGSHGKGGVHPCETCPLHSYQMLEGASECVSCPGGLGTNSTGSARLDQCVAICGDGKVATSEACDDFNVAAGDGCSESCKIEEGWVCELKKAAPRHSVCHRAGEHSRQGKESVLQQIPDTRYSSRQDTEPVLHQAQGMGRTERGGGQ
jgi:cysteine-rich repeat protein